MVLPWNADKLSGAADPLHKFSLGLSLTIRVVGSCESSDRHTFDVFEGHKLGLSLTLIPFVHWLELLEAVGNGTLQKVLLCFHSLTFVLAQLCELIAGFFRISFANILDVSGIVGTSNGISSRL